MAGIAQEAAAITTIDLGSAKGYSVLVFGNVASFADVEGRAAIGGNVLNGFDAGYRSPFAAYKDANGKVQPELVVGGNWNTNGSTVYGGPSVNVNTNASAEHSKVGPAAAQTEYRAAGGDFRLGGVVFGSASKNGSANSSQANGYHQTAVSAAEVQSGNKAVSATQNANYFDFAKAKSEVTALSSNLNALAATGSNHWGTLTGSGSGDLQVFNLGSSGNLSSLSLAHISAGSHIVINSSATSVTLQGGDFLSFADRVIFNLPNATSVNLGWGGWGTLLAPKATVFGTGHWEGNLIANQVAFSNGGVASMKSGSKLEVGYEPFTGYNVSAVPEPGSYALMLAGLGALGFVARRRRQA
ncbi:choice-of-anchor A family protein [Paucibacter sp. APW11]|uniref:Choice-of-anchor A family protein n=1 Tax=Roseateles aquae TaxID=3077235 RepID=A0ABU3PFD2_9BURK|nr:choice-of-anchor A family protein [Paucibacter sp. APW11]MDT9001300.1 choice-of-anchor A family protein [Paucibacter sp. APW11]